MVQIHLKLKPELFLSCQPSFLEPSILLWYNCILISEAKKQHLDKSVRHLQYQYL